MIRQKWLLTLLSLVFLAFIAILPGYAQDTESESGGFVYLLHNLTGEFIRVGLDGTVTPLDLDLDGSAIYGPGQMAFTPDGSRAAFCTNIAEPDTAQRFRLFMRDLNENISVWDQDIEAGLHCSVAAINEDGSLMALALVNRFPDPNVQDDSPTWEMRVLNTETGEQVASLEGDIELARQFMPDVEVEFAPAFLPLVQRFSNQTIIFNVAPYASDGFAIGGFAWEVGVDGVTDAGDYWSNFGVSVLDASGETAYPQLDPNLPTAEQFGPLPVFNTVVIEDDNDTRTVYTVGADWQIYSTLFIEGGARMAIQLGSAFMPDGSSNQITRWIALDRAGNVETLLETSTYAQVEATIDGWVALSFTEDQNASDLPRDFTLTYGNGETVETVWTGETQNGGLWYMMWATPESAGMDDFAPFVPAG